MKEFSLFTANEMAEAALKKAEEFGKPISVGIVDSGGHLVCFKRSDKGKIGNISIAIDKAWTAVAFQADTEVYQQRTRPSEPAFPLHLTNECRPVFIRGGLLIKINGQIMGGIGVSGGTGEEDVACSKAGLSALE